MRVLGIDFTCSPSRRKPLTCAVCELDGNRLHVRRILRGPTLDHFERWLDTPGPWIAGCDFPFGLPAPYTRSLGLPDDWTVQVAYFAAMDRDTLRHQLATFRAGRPAGEKEPPRITDRLAGAQSAMKAVNPPVALMYQEGAARLVRSGACVCPCRPTPANRHVVETYPALLARGLVGRQPYKHDQPHTRHRERRRARQQLVATLDSSLADWLDLTVPLSGYQRQQLVAETNADRLDAVLCAVHAAWAWRNPEAVLSPPEAPCAEGWIPPLPRSKLVHRGR